MRTKSSPRKAVLNFWSYMATFLKVFIKRKVFSDGFFSTSPRPSVVCTLMGRGSAGARLWGKGRGSAGARLRGMGRGNDAKTAL